MLSEYTILAIIAGYFALLLLVSFITGKKNDGNKAFFLGNRKSPWYIVAFGMIGTSISGVTFVSVPGMVTSIGFTYLQMCIGFVFGYIIVAYVLLPIYYKLRLTTVYEYLKQRLGSRSYRTGASFFLLSKITGAAARLFIVAVLLHSLVFSKFGMSFPLSVAIIIFLIWLYTFKSGIKTIIWTDSLQTLVLLSALVMIIVNIIRELDWTTAEAVKNIAASEMSRTFVFSDWASTQNFWKQLLSGAFVVIVMTGLDQDMMQKNLTCRTLREAQKDMCTYGFAFVPANMLFMALGVLLMMLAQKDGIALPASGDELLPMFAATGRLGSTVVVLFTIGIVAASFSSADSALTALTTSYCVDIRQREGDEQLRRRAHIGIAVVFGLFILMFKTLNSTSVIDAIYIMCSYTYGPLLGLFAFGLFTNRKPCDKLVPYIAVASPLVCFVLEKTAMQCWGYKFGYELLMINGLLTFVGLYVSGRDGERRASVV